MAISSKKTSIHVVPSKSGWKVVRPSASRASSVNSIKKNAVTKAKAIARNDQTTVYVHRSDGKITSVMSYSEKSRSPMPHGKSKTSPSSFQGTRNRESKIGDAASSRKKK